MRIKFIEKWKFKFLGRAVPVIKVLDVDIAGKVNAIQLIDSCKDRPNSILCTWDGTEWEKNKEYGPIEVRDDKGLITKRWIVSEGGETVPLFTKMSSFPNRERALGAKTMMDDASEAMGLHPSLREKLIFFFVGTLCGWLFLAPIAGAMLK